MVKVALWQCPSAAPVPPRARLTAPAHWQPSRCLGCSSEAPQTPAGHFPPLSIQVSNGLSSFGILLTGRLELRNDLLSALSLGKAGVWDERYFVLTRKGLHFYVPQRSRNQGRYGLGGC